jgi:predicted nucleic acid-binding protein
MLTKAGVQVLVPEVADFEVRRELIRAGKTYGVIRLDAFTGAYAYRYVPITTSAMKRAAELWADARNNGVPTADTRALDADVILAAQALTSGFTISEIAVASSNVRHISRYVGCNLWSGIAPYLLLRRTFARI